MTKAELIDRLKNINDDTTINFVLFTLHNEEYKFQYLNTSLQSQNDPSNVIALVSTPIFYDTTEDVLID